ncbi:zeta toxin family protein [Streptomyces sp. XH2]|uniref:zeta toxin family protein n=1 Tax=Streptomyces sp. XH2 TaxID=3412483 RepID=UPI003C7D3C75
MSGSEADAILPTLLDRAWQDIVKGQLTPTPRRRHGHRPPRAVFVAGQPASQKTTIEDYARKEERLRDPVRIDADKMRELHPYYPRWVREDDLTAASKSQEAVGKWVDRAIQHVAERGFDVIVSATLKDAQKARKKIEPFLAANYDVFLIFTSVDEISSRLSIVERFLRGRRPGSWARYVPADIHDEACAGSIDTARHIDENTFGFDKLWVRVYRRRGNDTELAYKNHLVGGGWQEGKALTARTIAAERRSYWDYHVDRFRATAQSLLRAEHLVHPTLRGHIVGTISKFLNTPVCLRNGH